jgi:predicted GNAT family N-acyltransferase
MDYYTPELDAFDNHPDTLFMVILDNHDHVVGGRRILLHEPGMQTKLKTEEFIDCSIQEMLPHLNIQPMRYAELGGLALDKSIRGSTISAEFYRKTFDLTQEIGCDFMVAELTPANITRFEAAAKASNAAQIVFRTDQLSKVEDKDFRIFVSFKDEKTLPLLSPAQKLLKLGQPLSESEIQKLVDKREAEKTARRQRG